MGYQLTLTETLLDQASPSPSTLGAGHWEVGRLVLAPEYRSDVDALRHCLFLALSHACSTAQVTDLYASCTHVLGRLYRRFGFVVFARDVALPGADKAYTLIHGGSPQVLKGLSGPATTRP